MRAPDRLLGTRIVAPPAALDAITWPDAIVTIRLAADDLLVLSKAIVVAWSDTAALIEQESGFVGWWLTGEEVREQVLPHVEWRLPGARPALAQGLVAGVPAKLWLGEDRTLLLCAAAYAHELEERLR